jgi:hypothetical protein
MTDSALILEHSIEVEVSTPFAWQFRTDVATWNDPPATFQLDGAFVEGSRGTTLVPGREPVSWYIRQVVPERLFVIEIPLEGATLAFEWHFSALMARRTKLTQRIVLRGTDAAVYSRQIEEGFGATLQDGMKSIGSQMVAALEARWFS